MAGVIPNEIKQGGARAARVMKVRRGVPPAPRLGAGGWPRGGGPCAQSHRRRRWLPLKERKHGMDPRFSLQGLHKVHLRRAGVGEHVIHPAPASVLMSAEAPLPRPCPDSSAIPFPSPRGVQPPVF